MDETKSAASSCEASERSRRPTDGDVRFLPWFLTYLAASLLAAVSQRPHHPSAPVCPANGIAFAGLLLLPDRLKPFVLLTIYASGFAGLALFGRPLSDALLHPFLHLIEAVLAFVLFRHLFKASWRLDRPRDTTAFLSTAVLVEVTIGLGALLVRMPPIDPSTEWLFWWGGHLVGFLVTAPAFLVWVVRPLRGADSRPEAGTAEIVAVLLGLLVVYILLIHYPLWLPRAAVYSGAIFIVVLWAAFRTNLRILTAVSLLSAVLVQGTHQLGQSFFQATGVGPVDVVFSQFWLSVVVAVGLIVSSFVRHRQAILSCLKAQSLDHINLFRNMAEGFAVHEMIFDSHGEPLDYKFLSVNPAFERLTGLRQEDVLGRTVREVLPETEPFWIRTYGEVVRTGTPVSFEAYSAALGKWFAVTAYRPTAGRFAVVFRDITERRRQEEERERLEERLRQAQKMEAVGRLAGGIAHDANNILQVVKGHLEMALEVSSGAEKDSHLRDAAKAVGRLADLFRRILLFSRRQVMSVQDLDLNLLVENLLKMIRRLIGEHISVRFIPGNALGTVSGDPNMLEQAVMNLVLNARDAMPEGGELVLETENVLVDEAYVATHPEAKPGRYVLLSVTDTGTGIPPEVLPHIFEPFFTTKKAGEGTGLGLSTTYGIVKQHDGMITVYSEPGKGSTFKIYLPIVERSASAVGSKLETPVRGGEETVLVVEDDHDLRELIRKYLTRAGYRVLEAASGPDAVDLFLRNPSSVDLLLLDVVLPGKGGAEVFETVRRIRPDIKVLFSSGYSENGIHTRFVLKEGIRLLQKPYDMKDLLRAIREVLDAPPRPPAADDAGA